MLGNLERSLCLFRLAAEGLKLLLTLLDFALFFCDASHNIFNILGELIFKVNKFFILLPFSKRLGVRISRKILCLAL